jgi:hypothetical protein
MSVSHSSEALSSGPYSSGAGRSISRSKRVNRREPSASSIGPSLTESEEQRGSISTVSEA